MRHRDLSLAGQVFATALRSFLICPEVAVNSDFRSRDSSRAACSTASVGLSSGGDPTCSPFSAALGLADPGKEFRYGGVSMQVAGRIAEIVSGKSWEELFQERIAKPLEMRQSNFSGLGQTTNPRLGGSARSSMNDYHNFLTMIFNQGKFQGSGFCRRTPFGKWNTIRSAMPSSSKSLMAASSTPPHCCDCNGSSGTAWAFRSTEGMRMVKESK
jgi:hypothetical protein